MPWKFRERPEEKQWHQHRLARIAIAAVLCLGVALLPYAWIRYQRWMELRQFVRAHQAFLRGDYREALLNARGVLRKNPHNDAARQIVAGSTEALQSPEAMSWRRVQSAMEAGDTDQLLGLADAFVTAEDPVSAARALQRIKPEAQNSARFHGIAARVAAKSGNVAAAFAHWDEAVRLDPQNDTFHLELAALQLASDKQETQALGLSAIDRLKVKAETRLPALRLLLEDAQRHGDKARAREVAAIIAADEDAEFSDKLALLTTLRTLRPKRDAEFSSCLGQLEEIAPADPQNVFSLVGWMIDHNMALVAIEWAGKLPAEVVSVPPAAPGVAQAFMRAAHWKRLKEKVEAETWGELEFMRHGFLSLALAHLGDVKGADASWQQALEDAQADPSRLQRLARACHAWDDDERMEEVLWRLGASDWCPRWAMDYLWSAAIARGDTAKLAEAARLRLKAQPDDVITRNNDVALALLTRQDPATTHPLAEQLYKDHRDSVIVASTYGLSLLQQGRAREAVEVMEAFAAEKLREPAVALYYGAFLAFTGQIERAEKYLALAESARSLPEEKTLRALSAEICRARTLENAGDTAGATAAWNGAFAQAGATPDLLESLAKVAIEWKWTARAEPVLLKLANLDRCPAWAIEPLWSGVLKTGDSAQILRVSNVIAKAAPNNLAAQNASVLLGLLSGREKDSLRKLAESLYKEHPDQPEIVATQALSLAQQGRSDEALALFDSLEPAQLREPRIALYRAFVLAAAGKADEAPSQLQAGRGAAIFPEERKLVEILQLAFSATASERAGDAAAADRAWNQALAMAEARPEWLETLARLALKNGIARHADLALWKLATSERCPRWAAEVLWTGTLKNGTPMQRYKASKLLVKTNPKDLTARSTSIILALLTGQDVDAPHRQAETLYKQNMADAGAAATYALSLHLQDRDEEALKLMDGMPGDHLRTPRAALYYGVLLASAGRHAKAAEFLRISMAAPMLPEERTLVEKISIGEPLKSLIGEKSAH